MLETRNLSHFLASEPYREENREENRVDGSHPVEDGEIIERIHGRTKVLKQLRENERRRFRNRIDSNQKYAKEGRKHFDRM